MANEVPTIAAAVSAAITAILGAAAGARYTLARAQKLRAEADSIIAASAGNLLDIMRKDLAGATNRITVLEEAMVAKSRSYDELNGHYMAALHRINELEDEVRDLRTKLEVYESGRRERYANGGSLSGEGL